MRWSGQRAAGPGLATVDAHSGYAVLLVTQLVVGTGVGAALTTIVSLTMHDVPPTTVASPVRSPTPPSRSAGPWASRC
ncbi:hypothetical protein ACFV1N_23265 [Streptosporangium canum]|uniref:hypothetical protein n=1 Tax=Streptosporangium canum TaxID=324952 RepID=UPI00367CAF9A